MDTRLIANVWGCAFLAAFVTGCGGTTGPELAPVKGKVTVGGSEPFKNGIIRFLPKEPSLNMREAITDDQGRYVIRFNASRSGLQPGDYSVSFSLLQQEDGSPLPKDDSKPREELGGVEFVPRDYYFGSTKNLTTVPEEGGTFDFDLPELKAWPSKKPSRRA